LRKHIAVYNLDNEIVTEFKSGREMAKYFQMDGKVGRAAIAKGEYLFTDLFVVCFLNY